MKKIRFDDPCGGCLLSNKYCTQTKGSKDGKILIVTKPPTSAAQASHNQFLSKDAKALFTKSIAEIGVKPGDVVWHSAVRCPYKKDEFKSTQRTVIENHCKEYLFRVIDKMKPKVIIPLGADAAKAVFGRNVKITKVRGIPNYMHSHRSVVLPMLDPTMAVMYPQHLPTVKTDCATLKRLIDNDYDVEMIEEYAVGEYSMIDDLEFLIESKPKVLSFDLETLGVSWWKEGGKILTMQFCTEEGTGYMLPWDHPEAPQSRTRKRVLKHQLKRLLQNPDTSVIGQNLKFDLGWVYRKLGFRFRIDHDTLALYRCIDENSLDASLDMLVKLYVPALAGYADSFNAKWDKSRMDLVPLSKLLNYGCLSYESLVQLGDGSWEQIGKLVESKYSGLVRSVNDDGSIVNNRVIGWYDNGIADQWYKLRLEGSREGRWGLVGPKFTEDHEIATEDGYVRVDQLSIGQKIATPDTDYSPQQQQVLIGTLLGDGGFQRKNFAKSGLRITQAMSRQGYAEWKADALMPDGYTVEESTKSDRAWRAVEKYNFRSTFYHKWAESIGVRNGVKGLIPKAEVLDKLSPLGIAVWYQDDGTLVHQSSGRDSCRIYCKVEDDIAEGLVSYFQDWLGQEDISYLHSQGALCFGVEATKVFHEQIAEYVHPDVQYKLLREFRGAEEYQVRKSDSVFYAELLEIVPVEPLKDTRRYKTRYCIKVQYAHNFVTEAGVVKNCGDTDAVFRLLPVLSGKVKEDPKLWNYYRRVMIPGINAFAAMEQRGMLVDLNSLQEFKEWLIDDLESKKQNLLRQIHPDIKKAHVEKGLSFSRRDFLRDILFKHPKGFRLKPVVFTESTRNLPDHMKEPSTSTKDHLPYFYNSCPFTLELSEYIKQDKLLTANVTNFKDKYVALDKHIHPIYELTKTVTGRSSSKEPNGQNFVKRGPLAKRYRRIFVAPEGHIRLHADLSQAELRIAADMANEKRMLQIYKDGGDIHKTMAMKVMGLSEARFNSLSKEEQGLARFKAKACIAEGTPVLTHEGWVPIEEVSPAHWVWDGVEWVSHDGCVYNGKRQVITHNGLVGTPDHVVYPDGSDPISLGEAKRHGRQIVTRTVKKSKFVQDAGYRDAHTPWGKVVAGYDLLHELWYEKAPRCLQPSQWQDYALQLSQRCQVWERSESSSIGGKVRRNLAKVYQSQIQRLQELRSTWDRVGVQISDSIYQLGYAQPSSPYLPWSPTGQDRQRWELCSGEPKAGNASTEPSEQARHDVHGIQGGGDTDSRPVEVSKTRLPQLSAIFGYYAEACEERAELARDHAEEASQEDQDSSGGFREESGDVRKVYDLLNAGPRHRYTVLGAEGPVIVSNCNFGFLYGAWWTTFKIYAKTQYGIDFTDREAKEIRNVFFQTFPGLDTWHRNVKAFAHKNGYVRSYTGRRRNLPMLYSDEEYIVQEAERQAVNSPVQGLGSDLGVLAIAELDRTIDPEYLQVTGFVHDDIGTLVPVQYLEWGIRTLKSIMENLSFEQWFGVRFKLPIVADIEFGLNGGEMYELKSISNSPIDFESMNLPFDLPEQEVPPYDGRLDHPDYLKIDV